VRRDLAAVGVGEQGAYQGYWPAPDSSSIRRRYFP
jgi:hypothetical protein